MKTTLKMKTISKMKTTCGQTHKHTDTQTLAHIHTDTDTQALTHIHSDENCAHSQIPQFAYLILSRVPEL